MSTTTASSEPRQRAPPETSPEVDVSPVKAAPVKDEEEKEEEKMPPHVVPCRVTCRAPKVEIDLHASVFRRQGPLTNSASSCSYVPDGTVFFNSHSACDGAVTLDESDGGSILLDCNRVAEDRLIVMCGSCYNNENILDLPGLEFLIKSEEDGGRVLYRATSDDIFERKFGAKLAAQVKRNRQSGLLTQLPTTSVSSTFVRLTDGGGSVHYPSVIVGVFIFDQGAWHFVRVGQTCQGTNMISMKADIASVPPKITKDKIESSGLSYSIFDANARSLGTIGRAQESDAALGVKGDSNGTLGNTVPQDEYDALVTKFQALAAAHNKLQTEYSALEIEITHRDSKIEQLTKKYRAMESRYETVLHQSQLASSDFTILLNQNLELKQALEEKIEKTGFEEEGVVTSLPLGPHRLEETEPVDQHSREHPQSGARSIPKSFRGLTKMLKGSKKKSSPSGSTVVEVSIGESPDSHTHPSDSSSLAEEHNTTTARKHHRHSDAEAGSALSGKGEP